MGSFGENLRREREMRGVTLEEISSATKISVRFLRSIEDEDFDALPGGIFARSFIRTYVRYLGLDEERILAEYQLTAHPKAEAALPRLTAGRSVAPRPGARTPFLALLAAGIMLGGGYLLFRYSHRASEVQVKQTSPEPAPATKTPSAPEAAPSSSSSATATPGTPASPPGAPLSDVTTASPAQSPASSGRPPAPSTPTTPAASAGTGDLTSHAEGAAPPTKQVGRNSGLVLQVAATERSWVGIEADGQTVFQGVLNSNEVRTLKARDSFNVTTGNAQGIILTLNGETLTPLGRRGEVKSVHLTRNDVKSSAP